MPSLEELASKGKRKYAAKLARMESSYAAATGRMKDHYGDQDFGPTRKSNYNAAIDDYAVANYKAAMKPELADKWADNWIAKMSE